MREDYTVYRMITLQWFFINFFIPTHKLYSILKDKNNPSRASMPSSTTSFRFEIPKVQLVGAA